MSMKFKLSSKIYLECVYHAMWRIHSMIKIKKICLLDVRKFVCVLHACFWNKNKNICTCKSMLQRNIQTRLHTPIRLSHTQTHTYPYTHPHTHISHAHNHKQMPYKNCAHFISISRKIFTLRQFSHCLAWIKIKLSQKFNLFYITPDFQNQQFSNCLASSCFRNNNNFCNCFILLFLQTCDNFVFVSWHSKV
jgi:hypothetical protein